MSGDDPMDWEAMEATEPQAGEPLERAMARYARVRLDPSPAQVRRARAAVMEAAWRQRIESRPAARRRHLPFAGWSARRIALAGTAAVFAGLCVGGSVFAASRAGGPLYDARIAFEDATLPTDSAARLQAQLANAQVRLAEAYDAAVRGDQGALTAALNAYVSDVATLADTTGGGAPQALEAVEQHRYVLLSLIEHAPSSALPGLGRALTSSDRAIDELTATESQDGNGNANGAGNGGAGNGNANGAGNGNANGAGNGNANGAGNGNANGAGNGNGLGPTAAPAAATPAATAKPAHSPKPSASPGAAATPRPTHSPKPVGSPPPTPQPTGP